MNCSRRHAAASFLLSLTLSLGCKHSPPPVTASGTIQTADGAALFFRVIGSGKDTILVRHGGLGLHHGYLVDALGSFADGRTFILYDGRGRGRSSVVPDGSLDIAHDVADVEAVRAHFGLERVKLFAHEWGAVPAVLYAKKYPARVERILIVSPPVIRLSDIFYLTTSYLHDAGRNGAYLAATGKGLDTLPSPDFCREFWGFAFSPLEVTDRKLLEPMTAGACDITVGSVRRSVHADELVRASLNSFNLKDTLAALAMPALVVEGQGAEPVVVRARDWAAALGNGRQVEVGAPMMLPWAKGNREFANAADAFLKGGWPKGALDPAHAKSPEGVPVGRTADAGTRGS